MHDAALPPFPAPRAAPAWPALDAHGLALSALHVADLPWLRDLYAETRADELAAVPWPDAMRRAFLDQQFDLQHRHVLKDAVETDFLAIERGGARIGRLYLRRDRDPRWIVDITLYGGVRGQGLGSALVRAIQADAASCGAGVGLHVAHHNPRARRLYERLGFVAEADTGTHARMRWRAPDVS